MADKTGAGVYLPITQMWDSSEIYETSVTSPEFKDLIVRLYQNLNLMATAVNIKDSGYYDTSEFVCGQLFFPNPSSTSFTNTISQWRQVYRMVVNFGALPATATKSVAHRILVNPNYSFTRIYGSATDPVGVTAIPLPFVSAAGTDSIEVTVDATNVNVTTISDMSAYTTSYIVLEYIKI